MDKLSIFGEISPFDISARSIRDALAQMDGATEVDLFLHSDGGDVGEGFSIYHQLLAHPARITAEVQGIAASMASVILMAADFIRMAENGFLVIHNPYMALFGGEAGHLREAANLLDAFKTSAVRAYRRHSPLSEDEISALMDAETWLTAEQAVAQGFAHEITGRVPAAARLNLSRFERVPRAARALLQRPKGDTMAHEESPEMPADETPESLWKRLGQVLIPSLKARPSQAGDVLTPGETAAVLALERQALLQDRARLHVDRDLAPHLGSVEPAQLGHLEPILLKLKTAELGGDSEAGAQYQSLTQLLPSLKSAKPGGELAPSDDGAPIASAELSEQRKDADQRRGISDERRAALMKKYPGCRPDAPVQEVR